MQDIAPFGLRLPPDLKAELEQSAAKHQRSLNAELVYRLRESIRLENRHLLDYPDAELVEELMARYDRENLYIRLGDRKSEG